MTGINAQKQYLDRVAFGYNNYYENVQYVQKTAKIRPFRAVYQGKTAKRATNNV